MEFSSYELLFSPLSFRGPCAGGKTFAHAKPPPRGALDSVSLLLHPGRFSSSPPRPTAGLSETKGSCGPSEVRERGPSFLSRAQADHWCSGFRDSSFSWCLVAGFPLSAERGGEEAVPSGRNERRVQFLTPGKDSSSFF